MLLDQDATRQHRKEAESREATPLQRIKSSDATARARSSGKRRYCGGLQTVWSTDLVESAHPGDGADVVGDGDQRGPGQVLFGHRLPLLL